MTTLAALFGGIVGLGVVLIVAALANRAPTRPALVVRGSLLRPADRWSPRLLSIAAALVAGALVGAITGWPVAALGTMAAFPVLRRLVRERGTGTQGVARLEALARWIELLRDTLHAAAGIEGAITASATAAPLALRPQAAELATRLSRMDPADTLDAGLRDFADEIDNYFGDLAVLSIIAASEGQGGRLAEQLDFAAANARALVSFARETHLDRVEVRATGRIVAVVTLGWGLALSVLSPGYFAFYGSPLGQLILLVGPGALFALSVGWTLRLSRVPPLPRLLTPRSRTGA